jgi:hypothetical protein
MKRKLFIGSSKEGQSIADSMKDQINKNCEDWLQAETWSDGNVFSLNNSALHSLVTASRKFDYGILVASKDDIRKSRGKQSIVPRDNVIFEMGMFLGSLGLTRAFLLVEKEASLPTDYNGITVSYFQRDVPGSLENAIDQIIKAISNTRHTFSLRPAPSAALAVGYFDNFIQPMALKRQKQNVDFKLTVIIPRNLKAIQAEKAAYKNVVPSTEISVSGDGSRPLVFERDDSPADYWDIPTTLSTLGRLMDILLPSSEIGVDPDKQDWIDHELRHFAGTIEKLAQDCPACRGKVSISWMAN